MPREEYIVSVNRPDGVTPRRMASYIREAMRSWKAGGGLLLVDLRPTITRRVAAPSIEVNGPPVELEDVVIHFHVEKTS